MTLHQIATINVSASIQ